MNSFIKELIQFMLFMLMIVFGIYFAYSSIYNFIGLPMKRWVNLGLWVASIFSTYWFMKWANGRSNE